MVYEDVDGIVSVWLGNFPDQAAFQAYIEERKHHDERSEREFLSDFAEEFGIEWYDDCFIEAKYMKSQVTIAKMLAMFSSSASYLDAVVSASREMNIEVCNTAVLLFRFAYEQPIPRSTSFDLSFVGTFPVDFRAPFVETPVFD